MPPFKILVIGLDKSGKSSAILKLTGSNAQPSNGWSFEPRHLTYKVKEATKILCVPLIYTRSYHLIFWDIGGSPNFRNIWPNYFANVHAIMYFVDSTDPSRFEESASALQTAYLDPRLKGKPLLIIANKNDLPAASSSHTLERELKLKDLVYQSVGEFNSAREGLVSIQECNVNDSTNLHRGIRWLIRSIKFGGVRLVSRIEKDTKEQESLWAESKKSRQEIGRIHPSA